MSVHQFPTLRECYTPPPAGTSAYERDEPWMENDLDAARGIYSWVGVGLVAWGIIFGLIWIARHPAAWAFIAAWQI